MSYLMRFVILVLFIPMGCKTFWSTHRTQDCVQRSESELNKLARKNSCTFQRINPLESYGEAYCDDGSSIYYTNKKEICETLRNKELKQQNLYDELESITKNLSGVLPFDDTFKLAYLNDRDNPEILNKVKVKDEFAYNENQSKWAKIRKSKYLICNGDSDLSIPEYDFKDGSFNFQGAAQTGLCISDEDDESLPLVQPMKIVIPANEAKEIKRTKVEFQGRFVFNVVGSEVRKTKKCVKYNRFAKDGCLIWEDAKFKAILLSPVRYILHINGKTYRNF